MLADHKQARHEVSDERLPAARVRRGDGEHEVLRLRRHRRIVAVYGLNDHGLSFTITVWTKSLC